MIPPIKQRDRGAILPMMAVGIVTLVGIAALVLDLGRLFVLKTEMQNAADAAALAAAVELDGKAGAQTRAMAAAKGRLQHLTNQSQVHELLANLDDSSMNTADSAFVFYNHIGSEFDEPSKPAGCIAADDANKCLATGDADSFYIKVRLNPETSTSSGSYVVDLFFLPVLRVFGVNAADDASTAASAVAGAKAQYICEYPPMMLCNPFEAAGKTLAQALLEGGIKIGDEVRLQGDGSWAPGNFGFLQPMEDGEFQGGAKNLGEGIETPEDQECTTMLVKTQPGEIEGHPNWAMNTRFDITGHGYNAPPAPNIMVYPEDTCMPPGACGGVDPRFGDGVWDMSTYWTAYHQWGVNHPQLNLATSAPGDLTNGGNLDADGDGVVMRAEVYDWEMTAGWMPCSTSIEPGCASLTGPTPMTCSDTGACVRPNNYPVPAPLTDQGNDIDPDNNSPIPLQPPVKHGYPGWSSGDELNSKRRILYVAVLNCTAQGVKGNKEVDAKEVAKFFLLERALQGNSAFDYAAEFLGMATVETDPDILHKVIQLYE
ncbi:MAG: hypothetical protein FNT29_07400 [Halothiobacillaceae bacterium]|nr:MAG: hypothetical protein FNT29_07400 [Halothiobacillaceae bacterium]